MFSACQSVIVLLRRNSALCVQSWYDRIRTSTAGSNINLRSICSTWTFISLRWQWQDELWDSRLPFRGTSATGDALIRSALQRFHIYSITRSSTSTWFSVPTKATRLRSSRNCKRLWMSLNFLPPMVLTRVSVLSWGSEMDGPLTMTMTWPCICAAVCLGSSCFFVGFSSIAVLSTWFYGVAAGSFIQRWSTVFTGGVICMAEGFGAHGDSTLWIVW